MFIDLHMSVVGASPSGAPCELERLAALHRYGILDTPNEDGFDRITDLACDLMDTPIALVSLVEDSRLWFKARSGISVDEYPREQSFCHYALANDQNEIFVVSDATQDLRFYNHPLVTADPNVRFYAAAPIVTPDGHRLGAVAVMSPVQRPAGLSASERRRLLSLAALAADEMELRLQTRLAREAASRAAESQAQEAALRMSEQRLWGLVNTMPECVVVVSREGNIIQINPAGAAMLGTALASDVEGHPVHNFIAPAHRDVWLEQHRSVCDGEEICWETELVTRGSQPRNIEVHAVPLSSADDKPPLFLAIARDVTERNRMQRQEALLTREVDHRAKNVLTVVLAALRLTPKSNAESYGSAVEGRVMALARCHTLLSQDRWIGTSLQTLIEGEMAPFLSSAEATDRSITTKLHLEGPPIHLPAHVVQPLGMILHELATNAIKHGALSVPSGRVAISWAIDETKSLSLNWMEFAGPQIEHAPVSRGFGFRMIKSSVLSQLRGKLQMDWPRDGLSTRITLPIG